MTKFVADIFDGVADLAATLTERVLDLTSGVVHIGPARDRRDVPGGVFDEEARDFREQLTVAADAREHRVNRLVGSRTGRGRSAVCRQLLDDVAQAPRVERLRQVLVHSGLE